MKNQILLGLAALPFTFALLVSPNSACASLCADDRASSNGTTPSYHTVWTDLTCNDKEYDSSLTSQKFKSCISCLQNSTAVSTNISDQEALIYNLRATVNECLYSFPQANVAVSSPCSIDYACLPLQTALTSNFLNSTTDTRYGYCTADKSAWQGSALAPCVSCLQATTDQSYLANFLITLEAACQQTPAPGVPLSVSGTLFTRTPLRIVAPANSTDTSSSSASPASTFFTVGTIIGIVLAVVILGLFIFSIFFIRRRARQFRERNTTKHLDSDLDDRWGAADISGPNGMGRTGANAWGVQQPAAPPAYELRDQSQTQRGAASGLVQGVNEFLAQGSRSNVHQSSAPLNSLGLDLRGTVPAPAPTYQQYNPADHVPRTQVATHPQQSLWERNRGQNVTGAAAGVGANGGLAIGLPVSDTLEQERARAAIPPSGFSSPRPRRKTGDLPKLNMAILS